MSKMEVFPKEHYALEDHDLPGLSVERIHTLLSEHGQNPTEFTITDGSGIRNLAIYQVVIGPDNQPYYLSQKGLEPIDCERSTE